MQVRTAHRARCYLHQQFVRTWLGPGDGAQLQGSARLIQHHCLHRFCLFDHDGSFSGDKTYWGSIRRHPIRKEALVH
jgi:hypothetical protein